LVPSVKKQPVHAIDQWTAAFQAFVAVYCERFPTETAQLMKYGAIVRDLAQRGANWKFYDENFRMLRQSELIPWDQIHSELWLRASVPKVKQPLPPNQQQNKVDRFFQGGFAGLSSGGGGNCTGCELKHQCSKCGLNHPLFPLPAKPETGGTAANFKTRVVIQQQLHLLGYPHKSRLTD